jgi:hypothetical protein
LGYQQQIGRPDRERADGFGVPEKSWQPAGSLGSTQNERWRSYDPRIDGFELPEK